MWGINYVRVATLISYYTIKTHAIYKIIWWRAYSSKINHFFFHFNPYSFPNFNLILAASLYQNLVSEFKISQFMPQSCFVYMYTTESTFFYLFIFFQSTSKFPSCFLWVSIASRCLTRQACFGVRSAPLTLLIILKHLLQGALHHCWPSSSVMTSPLGLTAPC